VKSPVPITSIPYTALQAARPARLLDLLVALEYGEWICRSAMYLTTAADNPNILPVFWKKIPGETKKFCYSSLIGWPGFNENGYESIR